MQNKWNNVAGHSFHSIMAEKEVNERSSKRQIRQPPSVPFVWEERPGIAKKNWRPEVSSVPPALPPPPVKLIVSVPFTWEEEPGKPLSCFSESRAKPSQLTPPANLVSLQSPLQNHRKDGDHKHCNDESGEININWKDGKHNMDLESFRFETDDSFSSTSSTMPNFQLSLEAMSNAVPLHDNPQTKDNDIGETPSSPVSEAESSTSSYATGISSLEGAAFLECLFPLYTPDFGLIAKAAQYTEESLTPQEPSQNDFDLDRNSSVMIRRPTTLGELIMMSRRRSYQRKAAQKRKLNIPMEPYESAFGCCVFGTSTKMFQRLQAKLQHQMKLL